MSIPAAPDETLTIRYLIHKKLLVCLFSVTIAWLLLPATLYSDFFIIEICVVLGLSWLVWRLFDIVTTQDITFYPDRIVKTNFLRQTVLPSGALVLKSRRLSLCLYHAAESNIRESVVLAIGLIDPKTKSWLEGYLRDKYKISIYAAKYPPSKNAYQEFGKVLTTFSVLKILAGLYLCAYLIYATYLSRQPLVFNGYAVDVSPLFLHLLFIVLAVFANLLSLELLKSAENRQPAPPLSVRLYRARRGYLYAALIAALVAGMGLPLFLLTGDKLDFYAFFLVGVLYFHQFYPRLTLWEKICKSNEALVIDESPAASPRRSLQVSLVLLGGLTLLTQNKQQTDFLINSHRCPRSGVNACNGEQSGDGFNFSFGGGGVNAVDTVQRGGFESTGRSF
ncbi:MAG: hypothetical protein ABSB19_06870 [Methylomonas sp.]|jgi:hypothetical protein